MTAPNTLLERLRAVLAKLEAEGDLLLTEESDRFWITEAADALEEARGHIKGLDDLLCSNVLNKAERGAGRKTLIAARAFLSRMGK